MLLKNTVTMEGLRNNSIEMKIDTLSIELLKTNNKQERKIIKGEISLLKKMQKNYSNMLKY